MKKTRVLLVDDHVLVRAGIRSLLEKMPSVEVAGEASNGREPLEAVSQNAPDVVLMDIAMKDMNGLETTNRMAKDCPEIKVLILSMLAKEDFVAQALRSGAKGYLLKDAATDELEKALQTVMGGGTYLSASVSKMMGSRNLASEHSGQSP